MLSPLFVQNEGPSRPLLALAPMQDVTDWAFLNLLQRYGGADVYFTEFFRVTQDSRLDPEILRSVTENPTGRPVVAQVIGSDIAALVRTARELQAYPVAGIDLNLGCPAPVVYRKCAGGGLLRDPERVDAIVGALRQAVTAVPFTVKTRVGFAEGGEFSRILEVLEKHRPDLVSVHGRTVAQRYRPGVRHDLIAQAVAELSCPVLANGDVHSADEAHRIWSATGARGVMVGRGAVRNPWLFTQIRQKGRGEPVIQPTGREVLAYVEALFEAVSDVAAREVDRVHRVKKHVNFVAEGAEATGRFLHDMRRSSTRKEFFRICREHLDHDAPMALEPWIREELES
ncbi:MAG TPA: tRNA-dihydrouridine synthase family protein [Verrucomicrobiales bacterium]|nr:tRNA-dihydrouridine synthase family protein [Verrucomicrobiales bacterium]